MSCGSKRKESPCEGGEPDNAATAATAIQQVYDEVGCEVCGTHTASSFRNKPDADCRVCNRCHCKLYRVTRKVKKVSELAVAQLKQQLEESAVQARERRKQGKQPDPRVLEEQILQDLGATSLPPQTQKQLGRPSPRDRDPESATEDRRDLSLPELQQLVLTRASTAPASLEAELHNASRAQLATPPCMQRVVLGLLPHVGLELPGDPPGVRHNVSCLLEVVLVGGSGTGTGATSSGLSSQEAQDTCQWQQGKPAGSQAVHAEVRLTVYAAAGAVACWHQAAAEVEPALSYCHKSRAPTWKSGHDGFSLFFSSAFCPQLDLFAAVHRCVATFGTAALQQPSLRLPVIHVVPSNGLLILGGTAHTQPAMLPQGSAHSGSTQLQLAGLVSAPDQQQQPHQQQPTRPEPQMQLPSLLQQRLPLLLQQQQQQALQQAPSPPLQQLQQQQQSPLQPLQPTPQQVAPAMTMQALQAALAQQHPPALNQEQPSLTQLLEVMLLATSGMGHQTA